MPQPLVPPLDLSAYDLSPSPAYFHDALKSEMADIDAFDQDGFDTGEKFPVLDLVTIALALATPIDTADAALSDFEIADFLADDSAATATSASIDTAIASTETTAGKVGAVGSKLTVPAQPIAGVAAGGTGGAAPPPPPVLPGVGGGIKGPPLAGAQAFITNINRPGDPGHFRVGDPWQITIKAPAGSAIYAVASHNGVSLGQLPFGAVPASGLLLVKGKFTADQLGSWIENWYAGTSFINQIVFEVK